MDLIWNIAFLKKNLKHGFYETTGNSTTGQAFDDIRELLLIFLVATMVLWLRFKRALVFGGVG